MSNINELTKKLSIVLEEYTTAERNAALQAAKAAGSKVSERTQSAGELHKSLQDEAGPEGYKNPSLVDYAKEHTKRLLNNTTEDAKAIGRGMKEEGKELVGNVKEIHKENAPKVAKAYADTKDALVHTGKGMKEEAKEFGGNVKEMYKEASTKAAPLVHAAKKAIHSATEDVKAAGRGLSERYKEAGLVGIAKDTDKIDRAKTKETIDYWKDKGSKAIDYAKEKGQKAAEYAKEKADPILHGSETKLAEMHKAAKSAPTMSSYNDLKEVQHAAKSAPTVDVDKAGLLTRAHAKLNALVDRHPEVAKYAGPAAIGLGALAAGVGALKGIKHLKNKN